MKLGHIPDLPHAAEGRAPRSRALRIHGAIAQRIGMAIVSGNHEPGDILHGEVASSEQLSVSRAAYREAVRILAAKGLVDARPKIGTRVNPRSKWNWLDPDILAWIFQSEPERAVLDGLFELRDLVEPGAAALAARRRTAAQLKALRRFLDQMRRHTLSTEDGRRADLGFHAALLDATHNPFLIALATSVGAAVHATTVFKQRKRPLRRDPIPDHERVYEAIARKDPGRAEEAMRSLIKLARRDTPVARTRSRPRSTHRERRATT
jgi:DNA-binding FadR family transcriptional regulator